MNEKYPFGQADASRAFFSDLKKNYISFNSNGKKLLDAIDPSVRVIVGKKGAGKTLYLKAIEDYLNNQIGNTESNYVTPINNEPPKTDLVTKISSWFSDNPSKCQEYWRDIWKITILRTTASHILYAKELNKYVANVKDKFFKEFKPILSSNKTPNTIFNELNDILYSFNSEADLSKFCNNPLWGSLEYELTDLLKNSPPIYFFLDQLDDDFTNSPHAWLSCQHGLFLAIFRMVRNSTYGGRLHVIACIREIVYAHILDNQHGSKFLSEAKIEVLVWNQNSCKYFLEKKIENLNFKFFINPNKEKSIENFFGSDCINSKREKECEENVTDYIIRHTMLMPRDIINIGNKFYEKKINITSKSDFLTHLKTAVRHTAKQIAIEQLKIASLFLTTKWIYNGAYEDGVDNIYSEDYMLNGTRHQLEKLILSIGKDRFSKTILYNKIRNKAKFNFEEKAMPFNSLFQSGLLGYIDTNVNGESIEVFFSESRESQYKLPLNKKGYVFHSCLIDHLNIKAIKEPVYAQY